MRYRLQATINQLDGVTLIEETSELPSVDQLLDAVAHELRRHEDFAASFTFVVVPKR
jgi:hypothetical protein